MTLLAAVIAILLAVASSVGAVLMTVAVGRTRRRLDEREAEAARVAARLSRGAADVRERLARATSALEGIREQSLELDGRMVTWTRDLARQRAGIERMRHDRLGPAVRLMRLVSTAARIAVLWR